VRRVLRHVQIKPTSCGLGFGQIGGLALRGKDLLGKQTLCQLSYSRSVGRYSINGGRLRLEPRTGRFAELRDLAGGAGRATGGAIGCDLSRVLAT
jgi:hypothetical protein